MWDQAVRAFRERAGAGIDHASLRLVEEQKEMLEVRRDVVEPFDEVLDVGAMVTVHAGGGLGYAATADLSAAGLAGALERAEAWARAVGERCVVDTRAVSMPTPAGRYTTPTERVPVEVPLPEKLDMLRALSAQLGGDPRVVDWSSSLWTVRRRTRYVTLEGADIEQEVHLLAPSLGVTAAEGATTVRRSLGDRGRCRQAGYEHLEHTGLFEKGAVLVDEALGLLAAPPCPTGRMDVVLAPDQMMLQIHESIGHPIELDRILGDERNYAGTSFVSLDMFGSYRYGSELLTVTCDPTVPEEMASYAWDDEGVPAAREVLIDRGLLVRPIGGALSFARAGRGEDPLAVARVTSWNRPAIDRMANLNIEPGSDSLEALIGGVERGVWMETNASWSIDDSRNKFQFGCELGRLIEDGELKHLVRAPGYRGVSAAFWRNLTGVGDRSTFEVLGTPFCGKGEPNQVIRVGHASPVCRFRDVEVFGGA